jgi:prepilin-type N-terminal cleavage/methylation domain-containing protein
MNRRGMTLIEMMVATTMTLIIMGIIAQLFGILGNSVSGSRTTLDMSQQLRAVANTLRTDLAGITVETVPPVAADSDSGYLEIIEGENGDITSGISSLTGDCDDILMFTSRSLGSPFVGKFENGLIESPNAEIAWFCQQSPAVMQTVPGTVLYTLYRRQLLAMDYVGAGAFHGSGINSLPSTFTIPNIYQTYDLSMRSDNGRLYANSLGDLTKRENRFMHNHNPAGLTLSSTTYPYNNTATNIASNGPLGGARAGEDIVMTNILSFDVRVYDPKAPIRSLSTIAVTPGDPGYSSGASTTAEGAYVDLNWDRALTNPIAATAAYPPAGQGVFQGRGAGIKAGTSPATFSDRIYDTWSTHYESNGINEGDGPNITPGTIDEGTNGIDDNTDGVIDDAGELETSPPYPVPLRGLEVRIRCYEPQSRQVRQVTVRHTFVPH